MIVAAEGCLLRCRAFPLFLATHLAYMKGMLRQYELVEKVKAYDPDADEALINRAYVFSVQKHGSQKRASGDPYFSHPVEVAGILTELKLDDLSVVTALLHDTLEDTIATPEEIESNFGSEVARLVDGVTKLSAIEAQEISATSDSEKAAENLRKFLLAMSDDIRVLLVKLADRLHNMRTLHYIPSEAKRRRIAKETMDIYAPLAERIGLYEFMREMQLLAFRELEPDGYETVCARLKKLTEGGAKKVEKIAKAIAKVLKEGGVEAEVSGREKHPYSIWKKMQERHVAFEQLTDIIAFRVITDSPEDCYRAMGVLHRHWKMVPGRFKDYISTPKRNGYKSLHTTLITRENMRVEIQIRDARMHREGEFGLAAHWAYKHDGERPDGQAGWIRDLMEILDQTQDADELLEHTRMAMYQDRIFAFSPKGALHQLPKGATPVDFAYEVHTDLGDQTVGAKVNGRIAPLRTLLQNGDIVEILVSENQVPQAGWLSFVVTGKARSAIRRHIRSKERVEIIAIGRKLYEDIVDRIPARIGKKAEAAARERLKVPDAAALHYGIGKHQLSDEQVMEALVPGIFNDKNISKRPSRRGSAISIKGLSAGVGFGLAECCHPLPGDRIVGLRREGEGIQVHAIDCDVLANGDDADWVDLSWSEDSEGGTARLSVVMRNEPGMLAEVSTIFALNNANIINLRLTNREGDFHTFAIDLEVDDIHHLMRILSALRASDAVAQAERA